MKPDVLQQISEIEEKRRKEAEAMAAKGGQSTIVVQNGDGPPQHLTMEQVVEVLQKQQTQIHEMSACIRGKDMEIQILQDALSELQESNDKTAEDPANVELIVSEKPEDATPEQRGLHSDEDIIGQINREN